MNQTKLLHVDHACEIFSADGPTGRFAEVLAGEVQDYGANVLFAGTPDECVAAQRRMRVPSILVPTVTRDAESGTAIVSGNRNWSLE